MFNINSVHFMKDSDVSYVENELMEDGKLVPRPSKIIGQIHQNDLALWCYRKGFYCIPSTELIDWLKDKIGDQRAIEIGAGHGAIGRSLGIPITDYKAMEIPEVAQYYKNLGQPVTKYPEDIEKLEALDAVRKYQPDVVIGAWITQKWKPEYDHGSVYGVDDELLIRSVKTYIHIGNQSVHGKKKANKIPHTTYSLPFLFSRSMNTMGDTITVWGNT